MDEAGIEIGRVAALFRYPVKSMCGEAMDELEIDRGGVAGDRRYAFVRDNGPYLTGRQRPEMLGYVPYFSAPENSRHSAVRVRLPDGRDLAVESEELCEDLERSYGCPVWLLPRSEGDSYVDEGAVSMISSATIAALSELVSAPLDVRRFRPNILIAPSHPGDSPEDSLIGVTLQLGADGSAPRIRVQKKDVRCKMINVDPETHDTQVDLLAAMVHARRLTAGVYARVERAGIVVLGAPVLLLGRE